MTSLKTYLINDNGEYKLKDRVTKDLSKITLKNTFEDRKTKMKMAQLAKITKENEKNKIPEVVHVNVLQKTEIPQEKIYIQQPKPLIPPPMNEYFYAQKYQQKQNEELKKKIQKETDDVLKANGKETKEDEKQRILFSKICKIVGIQGHPQGKLIPFDTLNDPQIIKQLFSLQDILKEVFPSSKLTALHSNAVEKQQFPGVNLVRQIFKELGYKMKPINISEGYVGTKKILRREYQILKI